jgi:hypothetical protein
MRSFTLLETIFTIAIFSLFVFGVSIIFKNLHENSVQSLEKHKIDSKISNANLQLSKLLSNKIDGTLKFSNKKLSWFSKSPQVNSDFLTKIVDLNESNRTHLNILQVDILILNEILSSFQNSKPKTFFGKESFSGNFTKIQERYFFISKDGNFSETSENFEFSFLEYSLELENQNLYLYLNGEKTLFLENVSFFDFDSSGKFEICISEFCQKQLF